MKVQQERILAATHELCVEEGFKSVSMRRVARRVGISATAIYRHFKDKSQLIEKLLERARNNFMAYLTPALEGRTPRDRFDRAGDGYLRFALEKPHDYELLFMTPNQFGLFGAPNTLAMWRNQPPLAFQFCVERVAECMQAGDFRSGDPVDVALSVAGLAHGLVSLYQAGRFGQNRKEFRQLYHRAIDRLLQGIATRAPEPGL